VARFGARRTATGEAARGGELGWHDDEEHEGHEWREEGWAMFCCAACATRARRAVRREGAGRSTRVSDAKSGEAKVKR